MRRALLSLAACAASIVICPMARAEIQVGAATRVITPDPLLPVSGGMGGTKPTTEKRGELTARAVVFKKGDVPVAVVGLDLLGFPAVLGDRIRKKVPRIPAENILIGASHTHSASRLLRLPRRQRRPHGRPQIHGLRLRQGRRGDQRGDR